MFDGPYVLVALVLFILTGGSFLWLARRWKAGERDNLSGQPLDSPHPHSPHAPAH
jgi:hypothetical protein